MKIFILPIRILDGSAVLEISTCDTKKIKTVNSQRNISLFDSNFFENLQTQSINDLACSDTRQTGNICLLATS